MMSLFSLSAHAQSVLGSWVTDGSHFLDEDAAQTKKADVLLTFKADGTVTMSFDVVMEISEDGIDMTLGVKADMRGTYKKTGDNMKLNMKPEQTKVNLYKTNVSLSAEMEQALAAMGMTKQQLNDVLQQQFKEQDFRSMFSGINSGDLHIIKLTNSTMTLSDEGGVMLTFTRKQ